MTYNYRAFHGTRAFQVPTILDEGIKADWRRVFFGVNEKDSVSFPREERLGHHHAGYGISFNDFSGSGGSLGKNWFRNMGADIELDHRVLKDAEWINGAGGYNDVIDQPRSVNSFLRDNGSLKDKVSYEYTLNRDVSPLEIKRVHVENLPFLPEVFQDLVFKKAREKNIPLSYNLDSARGYSEYTNQSLIENPYVKNRSGVFEVANKRFNNVPDALEYSKEVKRPVIAFYNNPRPQGDLKSLQGYENWLKTQSEKQRAITGRASLDQQESSYLRRAKMDLFDALSSDYAGTNTEKAIDMQRRMARQEPVINRTQYMNTVSSNAYQRTPQAEEARRTTNLETQKNRAKAMLDINSTFDSLQVPQDYRDKILDRVGGYHPDRVKSVWEAVQSGRITL